jgi:two-component system alkaline phosphatase synthesis response regulator PhoP
MGMSLIYIVEDDVNIREIQRYALKNSGFETKEFDCKKDLFQSLEQEIPSLILLDIMLPGEDGLDILTTLRKNRSTKMIPVIMVTAKTTELDKVKGLDLGADDYMTKPFGIMELISRVKALLRRTRAAEEDLLLSNSRITLDVKKHLVLADENICELTYKEFELLKMLLVNRGIVLSRDQIMDQVWGFEYEGESRTVDMHIKTLRQKLGDAGSVIKTVRNVGYSIKE